MAPRATAVYDEFSRLRTAIVHDGSNARDVTMEHYRGLIPPQDLAKHPESGPSSRLRLFEQHRRLRELLAGEGVELLAPETQEGAPCQVFTRDPSFAVGRTLFIGGLRDAWRQAEPAGLAPIRSLFDGVRDISGGGAVVEGGDVFVLDGGKLVLVGMNKATNEAGVRSLAGALAGAGAEVVPVPHDALHLDCCLAPLPDGTALYAEGRLPEASLAALRRRFERLVALDAQEAALQLAANMLWLDERRVLSGAAAKKTNALLRGKSYEVLELEFSELVAQWGSVRCVVCPLARG